ncbi:T9SS type A sorting domain-containing protein [Flavobacterium sp.]|uniref:T9SS type A sorting domain-containing protein n=1 Tax=Flavobacterium sp. TaxID=239 RepID=UPI00375334CC
MKNLLVIILLSICSITSVRSQDILWEKSYGGKHADYLMDAIPTADYGFILAGSSLSKKTGNKTEDNFGDLDYWIWKMDEKGELDWQKSFGGNGSDFLQSISATKDGGFILAGISNSTNISEGNTNRNDKKDVCRGNDDFWIIKLDAKGNEEWQKTIGGFDQEKLQSVLQTKDGGYILGGSSSSSISNENELGEKTSNTFGNLDYWIVKLDSYGKIEWQKSFGGIYIDELKSIEQTIDKGYIVGGNSNSPVSGNKTGDNKGIGDYWVLKIDAKGEIEWQKTIGGDKDDELSTVHQTIDGNYIIGGNSNSDSSNEKSKGNENGTDFWILKLDSIGDIIWQETYNIGKVDVLNSLIENSDRSLLLGGFAQSEINESNQSLKSKVQKDKKEINDYVALKINENGVEIWRKSVGSSGEDVLRKAIETRDGGYLLSGTSNSKVSRDKNSNIGSNDFWVVKLKDNLKPTKIKNTIEAIPNPSIGFTNVIVGYDFETGTATVVDISGRQLQKFDITSRTVPIDLSKYPTGIYIINIKTNIQSDGVKVIKK